MVSAVGFSCDRGPQILAKAQRDRRNSPVGNPEGNTNLVRLVLFVTSFFIYVYETL